MQKYVEQLIDDMQIAQKRPRPPKMELPPELEFMRGAEEFLHGDLYEMGNLFGLEKLQFPTVDRLNSKQINLFVLEFEKLWYAFNYIPDFPDGLPDTVKYKLFVDYLDYSTNHVSQGHQHIEFCSYDLESCPFPEEFCQCKDYEFNDDDIDMTDITGKDSDMIF